MVFVYDTYYPSGGWNDFLFDADTLEEVKREVINHTSGFEFLDIIDSETKERIELSEEEESKIQKILQERRDKQLDEFIASRREEPTPHEHLQSLRSEANRRKQQREERRKNNKNAISNPR